LSSAMCPTAKHLPVWSQLTAPLARKLIGYSSWLVASIGQARNTDRWTLTHKALHQHIHYGMNGP